MTVRRALPDLVLAAAVLAIFRWVPWLAGMSEPIVLTAICATTFVVLALAVVRHPSARSVWLQMTGSSLALTAHHGSFLLWCRPGSTASSAIQVEIAACAGVAAVLAGSAMFQVVRPLLSYSPTRRTALWSVPTGLIGASSVPLADPLLYPAGRGPLAWFVLCLAIATIAGLALAFVLACRPLVRAGRTIELRLTVVFLAFLGISVFATLTDHEAYWAIPGICAMVGVAATSLSGSAGLASTPITARPLIARIRRRWAALGALPIVLMTPAIHLGAPPEIAIGCFALTTAVYAVFVRDVHTVGPAPAPRRSSRAGAIARALPAALIHDQLTMYYQPIIRVHDRTVIGFEALLRWHDDALGEIAVDDIIEAARWCGLAATLDGYVVEQVSRQLPTVLPLLWADEPYLAVNVSPVTLQRPGFAVELLTRLAASGCSVDGLVLEIVEDGAIEDWATLRENAAAFQHAGALIALDDFGTGTSNLRYLSEIDADLVKLDRALVQWATSPGGYSIVARVVELTRTAGLRMVAEGIEDAETLGTLAELGVEMVQGYLFGRPAPLSDALTALTTVQTGRI